MTQEQFDRWLDFATRMARACYPAKPRSKYYPSAAWIEQAVRDFLANVEEGDICTIRSWDHSDPYPEGHRFYKAEIMRPPTGEPWVRRSHGPLVCDLMSHFEWDGLCDIPFPKKMLDRLERLEESDADGAGEKTDEIRQDMIDRWYGEVHCCVRAGLDFACEPSAGVMGFTAGDLRKMYPEGVPDWITGGPDHKWETQKIKGECAIGLLLDGPPVPNGTFASIPDDQAIWL